MKRIKRGERKKRGEGQKRVMYEREKRGIEKSYAWKTEERDRESNV